MKKTTFALGYAHPSTVILVDDHAHFLRDMEINVPRGMLYKSFEDPREALKSINDFGGVERNLVHKALAYHGRDGENVLLQCDVGLLEEGIMDTSRFDLPTVLVTDYAMPGLDGLALCASINDRQVKKIMLTGQADENTGIDALNAGIIDGFVLKSRADAAEEVFKIATVLQNKYFTDLQNPFLGGSGLVANFFDDPAAISEIMSVIEQGDYVEHYLTTFPFGYVVVTAEGKIGRIGIFDEEDMQDQVRIAKQTNAPQSIIDRLESRTHAVMFYQMKPTSYQTDVFPWEEVITPSKRFVGARNWWICLDEAGPAPADYSSETASFNAKLYK